MDPKKKHDMLLTAKLEKIYNSGLQAHNDNPDRNWKRLKKAMQEARSAMQSIIDREVAAAKKEMTAGAS